MEQASLSPKRVPITRQKRVSPTLLLFQEMRAKIAQLYGLPNIVNQSMSIKKEASEDEMIVPSNRDLYFVNSLRSSRKRYYLDFIDGKEQFLNQEEYSQLSNAQLARQRDIDKLNTSCDRYQKIIDDTHKLVLTNRFDKVPLRRSYLEILGRKSRKSLEKDQRPLFFSQRKTLLQNIKPVSVEAKASKLNICQSELLKKIRISKENKYKLKLRYKNLNREFENQNDGSFEGKFKYLRSKQKHQELLRLYYERDQQGEYVAHKPTKPQNEAESKFHAMINEIRSKKEKRAKKEKVQKEKLRQKRLSKVMYGSEEETP